MPFRKAAASAGHSAPEYIASSPFQGIFHIRHVIPDHVQIRLSFPEKSGGGLPGSGINRPWLPLQGGEDSLYLVLCHFADGCGLLQCVVDSGTIMKQIPHALNPRAAKNLLRFFPDAL